MRKERNELKVLYCIGASVLLFLALFSAVVSAQTIKSNEMQTNILRQINEKMKDNDWKPGDSLSIRLLKDVMKDSRWFPGFYLFIFIWGLIELIVAFLGIFVF